jgi:hypothetical protein
MQKFEIKRGEVNIIQDQKLSVQDIMKICDVCRATVTRWMDVDGLAFVRVGKTRYTTVPVFEEWTKRDTSLGDESQKMSLNEALQDDAKWSQLMTAATEATVTDERPTGTFSQAE